MLYWNGPEPFFKRGGPFPHYADGGVTVAAPYRLLTRILRISVAPYLRLDIGGDSISEVYGADRSEGWRHDVSKTQR